MNVYTSILDKSKDGKKQFAVLIDPDKPSASQIEQTCKLAQASGVDYFFFGGSLLVSDYIDQYITIIKNSCDIPVVLFPGNSIQLSAKADALLFLSLISGRNAELLIGQHVISAALIKQSGIETIPTGYMLVESGKITTAMYISNSIPIPYEKDDVALCTALAGEMLGLKLIYMDGGSGAEKSISASMIARVKQHIGIPLIVGGGIKTIETATSICKAGADIVVVGNALESNPTMIKQFADAIHQL